MPILAAAVCLLAALAAGQSDERPDLLIADFEGSDYGGWKVEGEAFGQGPARGTLPHQMTVSGFKGKGLVNSFLGGDDTMGRLTSPPLKIERSYICFLIGGGRHPGEACINLLVNGRVVRTATGPNDRPGGSERLDWHSWAVDEWHGATAAIEIVDRRQGGWGHVNIDHIVQCDTKRHTGPAHRDLLIEKRYLHFPVKNGAARVRMKVTVKETIVDEFDIELADDDPDFWVFLDMAAHRGLEARIDVNRFSSGSGGLAAIRQADDVPDANGLYREKYRPQFHFSPRRGWNNDPNGLVHHDGEWHLFFQHNPYGWKWGNMHWGHAVSCDLVCWAELPIAIYPFSHGDWVFSGSAVVDWNNTAGFKTGKNEVIVAAYTSTGRGESIAFSNDRGRTFTDYEGNPVVVHRGRDPKIIRHEPTEEWVMAVYDEAGSGSSMKRGIAFYTSADLKEWTLQSRIDGYYECPEIFELPVAGEADGKRWVVYAADGAYAIGSFDGRRFLPEHEGKFRFNWGNCFYASQTFSDVPDEDGRRIQIAWGRIGHADMPFNQQMNFPVELTLRPTEEGPRLFAEPVAEIERLHRATHFLHDMPLEEGKNPLARVSGELLHIKAEVDVGNVSRIVFGLRGQTVHYDAVEEKLVCHDQSAPMKALNGAIRLEILVDRLSIEIFGNDGRIYMPMGFVLDGENRSLSIEARGGRAEIRSLKVHMLGSAWKR